MVGVGVGARARRVHGEGAVGRARRRGGGRTSMCTTRSQTHEKGTTYGSIAARSRLAMLRPTMSPTLYVQMAGRGMRPKTTVKDCLVLDFAGLVEEHGPITNIREPKKKGTGGEPPMKVCPECQEIIHISVMTCPSCGHMFPPPDRDHHTLHDDDIMKGPDPKKMEVTSWKVAPHTSFSSGKDMIRITYYGALSDPPIHEYLTIFHEGYAGEKAARSLSKICQNAGIDMESDDWRAWCDYATAQGKPPGSVSYLKDGKFFRVTGRSWE